MDKEFARLTCLKGHSACEDYEQVEIIYHQYHCRWALVILPIALFFFTMHWFFGMARYHCTLTEVLLKQLQLPQVSQMSSSS